MTISEPRGVVLHEFPPSRAGKFGFTSEKTGDYKFCFKVSDLTTAINTKVKLDIKLGIAAKERNQEEVQDLGGIKKVLGRMEAES